MKSIRLVPVSTNKTESQPPPILERMEETDDINDQPPTLSPIIRKSQRTKPFKDFPVLEPTKSLPSTSKTINEMEKKDLVIKRLRHSLLDKTTEMNLLKKKLKITEELLQFYQNNHWKKDEESIVDDLLLKPDHLNVS